MVEIKPKSLSLQGKCSTAPFAQPPGRSKCFQDSNFHLDQVVVQIPDK